MEKEALEVDVQVVERDDTYRGDHAVANEYSVSAKDGPHGFNVQSDNFGSVAVESSLNDVVQSNRDYPQHDSDYETPSRKLSILVEGREYLKYKETFERLLFAEKMTASQKDAKMLRLAMECLVARMDAVSAKTGDLFVKAVQLNDSAAH
jgi:hypothetical protein